MTYKILNSYMKLYSISSVLQDQYSFPKSLLLYTAFTFTPPPRGTQSDELLCSQLNTINSFITNDIYIREVPFPLQRGRVCNGLRVFENINIILYGPHVYFNNRCFIKKVCLKITKPLLIESEY